MKTLMIASLSLLLAGCSVLGNSNVAIAPYEVIMSDQQKNIDIRTYDSLILVSTEMTTKNKEDEDSSSAFYRLFNYISGENISDQKIPMTAPVFMDDKGDTPMMSFVLPASYTIDTAPKPQNPDVKLSELKDYTVAVIRFSGTLSDKNVAKHKVILEEWIAIHGYDVTGAYKKAGYNAPFTLPMFRRNEVIIPIKKPIL